MNTQFIIDLPTLALALTFYFTLKCIYYLVFYFCCNSSAHWHSGYAAGHNALVDKLKPDVDKLVQTWNKLEEHLENTEGSKGVNSIKANDRKIPG